MLFLPRFPSERNIISVMKEASFAKALVVCDRKLKNKYFLRSWVKNPGFSFYFVSAGESTKSIEKLTAHLKKILNLSESYGKDQLVFISLGGGSIGDLTGFLSSVYKRGSSLIHIPTTWLAALDSSHGGKTALNFSGIKNFIGTYHFPKAVFIVDEILENLPLKQKRMAFGELLKIALIEGGGFYKDLHTFLKSPDWKKFPWKKFLKKGIAAKVRVVKEDPFEKKNLRRKLNFGHTIGHVLETAYAISHGEAVLLGMLFSIKWSARKKLLSKKNFYELQNLISSLSDFKGKPLFLSQFKKRLEQDKKSVTTASLEFVFIKGPGSIIIKKVRKEEVIREAQRQGLVKKNGK